MSGDWAALKQQIKDASDIVDVVGSYVSLRPAGAVHKGLCPFHEDHNPSFTVDPRRQNYRCWACNKYGDVFSFVQEIKHVGFMEAVEELARRAGISLENQKFSKHGQNRARMLDVVSWAGEQFHQCLLDAPVAEPARIYLGERKLSGETVRRFALGFAPPVNDWLVQKASQAGKDLELLEQVGLIGKSQSGSGCYDKFRGRVMFPIRDMRGQTVGFGGRVLPSSVTSTDPRKYLNSPESVIFSKSEQLYGIDQARPAAIKEKYLAVVEGYTDVLMAHQLGLTQVVATMGTALNDRHVRKLRHVVPAVVLVFDADAGGNTGVDRALEVFVRGNLDLRIAQLPEGLDPCDLLVAQGVEPLRKALENAVEVLEYKLEQVWQQAQGGVDAQERAVEQLLAVLALTPELESVRMTMMVNRIAHRFYLKEETLWSKLTQLHAGKKSGPDTPRVQEEPEEQPAHEPSVASPLEKDLLKVLLGEPGLVALASAELSSSQIEHAGTRKLIEGLYRLHAEGETPDLDHLYGRLDDALLDRVRYYEHAGQDLKDRRGCLKKVLERYRERARARQSRELISRLQSADAAEARELLRKLQP